MYIYSLDYLHILSICIRIAYAQYLTRVTLDVIRYAERGAPNAY